MVKMVPNSSPAMIEIAMEYQKPSVNNGAMPKIVVAAAFATGRRRETAD